MSNIWRPFCLVLQGRWRLYAVNKITTPNPQPFARGPLYSCCQIMKIAYWE